MVWKHDVPGCIAFTISAVVGTKIVQKKITLSRNHFINVRANEKGEAFLLVETLNKLLEMKDE